MNIRSESVAVIALIIEGKRSLSVRSRIGDSDCIALVDEYELDTRSGNFEVSITFRAGVLVLYTLKGERAIGFFVAFAGGFSKDNFR